MFDPGALGTLLIGLNAERADRERDRRRPLVAAARRRRQGIRVALASGFRRAAELLDRPIVRGTADQAG